MTASRDLKVNWKNVPTRTITACGVEFAHRELGTNNPGTVLVANGDSDRMVPSNHSHDLARRLPKSGLIIDPDSGHGAVFQFHADFVPKALEFLAR